MNARIFIYVSDVQILTGLSQRSARRILQRIKDQFNKPKESYVTFTEFAQYNCIPEDQILNALNLKKTNQTNSL